MRVYAGVTDSNGLGVQSAWRSPTAETRFLSTNHIPPAYLRLLSHASRYMGRLAVWADSRLVLVPRIGAWDEITAPGKRGRLCYLVFCLKRYLERTYCFRRREW